MMNNKNMLIFIAFMSLVTSLANGYPTQMDSTVYDLVTDDPIVVTVVPWIGYVIFSKLYTITKDDNFRTIILGVDLKQLEDKVYIFK